MCVTAGWKCPGPVQGAIFINVSEGIRKRQTMTTSTCSKKRASVRQLSTASQASALPNSYQPCRGEIFHDLYIGHFTSAQGATMHPWILELPKLASSPTGGSEQYGTRAATLALYAKLSNNCDLEIEAARWYSKGLDAQREQIPLATKSSNYQPCIHRAVGAATMFSYFESIMCTIPMGWLQHYTAAIKLLKIAGPEQCQSGLMHMFFRSLRVAAVR